jgi:hypothetical protein
MADSQSTGKATERIVDCAIQDGLDWDVINLNPDPGEDRLVCIKKDDRQLSFRFLLQIKGTEDIDVKFVKKKDCFSYSFGTDHLNRWEIFDIPVVIMLCDRGSRTIYWEIVQDCLRGYTEAKRSQGTFTIHIPRKNVLDQSYKRLAIRVKKMCLQKRMLEQTCKETLDIASKYKSGELIEAKNGVIIYKKKRLEILRIYGDLYRKIANNIDELKEIISKIRFHGSLHGEFADLKVIERGPENSSSYSILEVCKYIVGFVLLAWKHKNLRILLIDNKTGNMLYNKGFWEDDIIDEEFEYLEEIY